MSGTKDNTNSSITVAAKIAANLAEASLNTNSQTHNEESESSKLAATFPMPQQKNETEKSITTTCEMEGLQIL